MRGLDRAAGRRRFQDIWAPSSACLASPITLIRSGAGIIRRISGGHGDFSAPGVAGATAIAAQSEAP